jgi:two-component system CheB/CheR fusion protein
MQTPRNDPVGIAQCSQVPAGNDALEKSSADIEQGPQGADRARDRMATASRANGQFLAVLSHELRTPLTPIVMALRTLLRRSDLPQGARDALETIQRNVKIEARLIDDLLDMTSISYGRFGVDLAPMDLHDAINSAVDMCAPEIGGRNQTLAVSLLAPRHHIDGDFDRLRQAVSNLLKNASKFTRDEGAITVASRAENDAFLVSVSDNGIGIERDVLSHVFDPFRQGDRTTREYGGLGLGLAIAKATVEAHGGTLTVESTGTNRGATFTVRLPFKTAPFRARAAGSAEDDYSGRKGCLTYEDSPSYPRG